MERVKASSTESLNHDRLRPRFRVDLCNGWTCVTRAIGKGERIRSVQAVSYHAGFRRGVRQIIMGFSCRSV
jgi:hypothetical protein